jgi:phospholipase C
MSQSQLWEKALLVITYDKHGGFYDHVEPGAAADDRPGMRFYGPRVPALVVSPWVALRSGENFCPSQLIGADPGQPHVTEQWGTWRCLTSQRTAHNLLPLADVGSPQVKKP